MYALIIYNLGESGWYLPNPQAHRWESIDYLGPTAKDCRSRISYIRKQRPNLTIRSVGNHFYTAYIYRAGKRLKAWEAVIEPIELRDLRLKNRWIDRL